MKKNEAYAQANKELESDTKDDGIWAKSISLADGNMDRTKSIYIRLRANDICGFKFSENKVIKWAGFFLIPRGRRGRGSWFLWNIANISIIGFIANLLQDASNNNNDFKNIFIILVVSILCYLTINNTAKRLHDLNLSGWLSPLIVLSYFIPVLGVGLSVVFGLSLLLVLGTPGMNKYGEQPKGFLS